MKGKSMYVGIIGAGANSRLRHIPGFQAIEGVKVVAVANRTRESGEAAAKEFGIARVFDDWRALIADPEIDAVCIGTWPYLHGEATVESLKAGKHVLCEARMARNLDEARQMDAAAKKHPHLVAQLVPSPFTLGVDDWITSVLEEEKLGELNEIRVRFLNGVLRDPQAPMSWRLDHELSGNNTMVMGILHEAILRWIALPELMVSASAGWGSAARPDSSGELQDTVIPESLQVVAHPSAGPRLLYDLSQLHAGGPENSIRINGSRGSLFVNLAAGEIVLDAEGQEREVRKIEDAWDVEGEFVRSIREGAPVTRTSFADGLEYMAFTEAVWESWSTGAPVEQQ